MGKLIKIDAVWEEELGGLGRDDDGMGHGSGGEERDERAREKDGGGGGDLLCVCIYTGSKRFFVETLPNPNQRRKQKRLELQRVTILQDIIKRGITEI